MDENGEAVRRSVVDDFTKAKDTIMYYIALANGQSNPSGISSNGYPAAKEQKKGILRFPGTNTWYIKGGINAVSCTNRGDPLSFCQEDTKEHAEQLAANYDIFGWDCEWRISDSKRLSDETRSLLNNKINDNSIDYNNTDHTDPYFDLYSEDYINVNRPVESVGTIRNTISNIMHKPKRPPFDFGADGKTPGKVVLLMHDRQFRKGKLSGDKVDLNDTTNLNKLGELIDYFKKINTEFKTLDEY